ncbi:MAG: hypothetical protein ACE5E7_00505 [Anaerolineae bacterium]
MLASDNVWAVSANNKIWHYDGTNWTFQSAPQGSGNIYDITMLSTSDGWVIGNTTWHWDGSRWSLVGGRGGYGIDAASAQTVWASNYDGILSHWTGSQWELSPTPASYVGGSLNDVDMLSSKEGWSVGQYGFNSTLIHWDGVNWTSVPATTTMELFTIETISAVDAWAGGTLTVLHWNGSSWNAFNNTQLPVSSPIVFGISAISSNDVWMVGRDDGAYSSFIWRWDGTNWNTIPHTTTINMNDVAMLSSTDGWVVGNNGTLMRWDGAQWNNVPITTTNSLMQIDMVSANDGWLISMQEFFHWDGVS